MGVEPGCQILNFVVYCTQCTVLVKINLTVFRCEIMYEAVKFIFHTHCSCQVCVRFQIMYLAVKSVSDFRFRN